MGVKSYNSKVIISGDIIEIYEYDKPILEGYQDTKKGSNGRSSVASEEDKKINRSKVLTRAKRDLRRIVNSNIHKYGVESKFVTLTFEEDVQDMKKANYEFKKFRQRLEYELRFKLKYAVVPEIQKKREKKYGVAVWHYHVVMFNLPYIRQSKLCKIWSNGIVGINRIDNVDNVGAYVCKYMSKDNNEERLVGFKSYFTSRGLYKPIEIKEKDRVNNLAVALPVNTLTYSNTFENEYNKTIYKQYNMSLAEIEEVK